MVLFVIIGGYLAISNDLLICYDRAFTKKTVYYPLAYQKKPVILTSIVDSSNTELYNIYLTKDNTTNFYTHATGNRDIYFEWLAIGV